MIASNAGSPPARHHRVDESPNTASTTSWGILYRIAGAGALITAVLIPLQVAAYIVWPPPLDGSAANWFALFHKSRFIGLLSLDLLMMADYVLLVPIITALYFALRNLDESLMALGTALFFVAICIYFSSNTAFEVMALSDRFVGATTEAERAILLGAGEAMLATYQGTAFHVNYVLGSIAGILISWVMLHSPVFSRAAGYAGITGNLVGLGLYIPSFGMVLGVASGPILWVWYILIGLNLLRLARRVSTPASL